MTDKELKKIRKKFEAQKWRAKDRGIEWCFTFDEWLNWWLDSGHWHERGRNKGQYQMCRKNDAGPYHPDNVYCDKLEHNTYDGNFGKTNTGFSKPVIVQGIWYPSIREAARHHGLKFGTMWSRFKHKKPGYEYA